MGAGLTKRSSKADLNAPGVDGKAAVLGLKIIHQYKSRSRLYRKRWKELLKDNVEAYHLDASKPVSETAKESVMVGDAEPRHTTKLKEVSLYISSTFFDTIPERNYLMEDVFPYLRRYCRLMGGDFRLVDMRWGRESAEGAIAELDLITLKRVKESGVGPCFACIVTSRYGGTPMPHMMSVPVFELVKSMLEERESDEGATEPAAEAEGEEGEGGEKEKKKKIIGDVKVEKGTSQLLDECFQLDENPVPPQYILRSPLHERAGELWKVVCQLFSDFEIKKWLKDEQPESVRSEVRAFSMSVSAREIEDGVRMRDTKNRVYGFFRQLDCGDSAEKPDHYFEQDAKDKLFETRESLRNSVPRVQLYESDEYTLTWRPQGESKLESGFIDERNVMEKFGNAFCEHVCAGILNALRSTKVSENELFDEVNAHNVFALESSKSFIGRLDEFEKLDEYFTMKPESEDAVRLPLVITGPSGVGKTSLVASAIRRCPLENTESLRPSHRHVSVIRFVGLTRSSRSVVSLLTDMVGQMVSAARYVYMRPSIMEDLCIPTDVRALVIFFRDLVAELPIKRLILFLDGLDQLDEDVSLMLSWLPHTLPSHVYMVLGLRDTTPSGEKDPKLAILEKTHQDLLPNIPLRESPYFVYLDNVNADDAQAMLKRWLGDKRKVSDAQQAVVDQAIANAKDGVSPLWLKTVSFEMKRWRSFDSVNSIAAKPEDILSSVIDKVVKEQGNQLISRALAYLSGSKYGLTNNEIEDLLSGDDLVLDEVDPEHKLPMRRIPPSVWTSVRESISDYLTCHAVDGVTVYTWAHRLFKETSKKKFGLDHKRRVYFHRVLANYWRGQWWASECVTRKDDAELHRNISDQPLILNNPSQMKQELGFRHNIYNRRKLSELPFQLQKSDNWHVLISVLTDLTFVQAMLAEKRSWQLISMYRELLNMDKEVTGVTRDKVDGFLSFTEQNASVLSEFPYMTAQRAINFSNSEHVREAGRNSGLAIEEFPSVILSHQNKVEDNLVATMRGHRGIITCARFSPNGKLIATGAKPKPPIASSGDGPVVSEKFVGPLRVWSATDYVELHRFEDLTEGVFSVCFSREGKRMAASSIDRVHVYELGSLKCARKLEIPDNNRIALNEVAMSLKGDIVAAYGAGVVYCWDLMKGVYIGRKKVDDARAKGKIFFDFNGDIHVSVAPRSLLTIKVLVKTKTLEVFEETVELYEPWKRGGTLPEGFCLFMEVTGEGARAKAKHYSTILTQGGIVFRDLHGKDFGKIKRTNPEMIAAANISSCRASNGKLFGVQNKIVRVWDTKSGNLLHLITGHSENVTCANWGPGAKQLVTSSEDGTVCVWDVETKSTQMTSCHSANILGVGFRGEDSVLTASENSVKLWQYPSGNMIGSWRGGSVDDSLDFLKHRVVVDPNGGYVLSIPNRPLSGGTSIQHHSLLMIFDEVSKSYVYKQKQSLLENDNSRDKLGQDVDAAFSPDGSMLITRTCRKGAVWDVYENPDSHPTMYSPGKCVWEFSCNLPLFFNKIPNGSTHLKQTTPGWVAISPGGRFCAVPCGHAIQVNGIGAHWQKVRDTRKEYGSREFFTDGLHYTYCDFTHVENDDINKILMITAGYYEDNPHKHVIQFWNLLSGSPVEHFEEMEIRGLATTQKWLLFGSGKRFLRVYNLQTLRPAGMIVMGEEVDRIVRVPHKDNEVVVGTVDGTVYFFKVDEIGDVCNVKPAGQSKSK